MRILEISRNNDVTLKGKLVLMKIFKRALILPLPRDMILCNVSLYYFPEYGTNINSRLHTIQVYIIIFEEFSSVKSHFL